MWSQTPTPSLYRLGGAGLLLAAVFLFPGNPLWDLSQTRVPNTILVYVSLLPIGVASYRDRERWLRWGVGLPPWLRRVLVTAVPLALAGLLWLFYWLVPLYIHILSSEWGLLEPLTFWLYWVAAWSALSLARLRQAQGQEAKPYVLVAVLCGIAVLEECDYLGLFGGPIGRIHGVYVGAMHDLFTLWYRTGHDLRWALAGLAGCLALASWLWHRGYLSGSFLRHELGSATSLPVFVGVGLLVLAQISDIDTRIFGRFAIAWCGVCEEMLEFFFAVLLNLSLLLKYARDAVPKAWDRQPKTG